MAAESIIFALGLCGISRGLGPLLDAFNITNHANLELPVTANRDLRFLGSSSDTFLVLTNLYGGGGFPRQAQLGVRLAF